MDGHFPDELESDVWRCGLPPNTCRHFYRMHKMKRFPTGPHTPWPNRAEMPRKVGPDHSGTDYSCQLMPNAATVRNTQVTLSGRTPMELAMGRRPRYLIDPAFMNPEQLTSTPTKQDLLNEEIQKLAMQTHLEVQQREEIRRDLAERMKFVPRDLRVGGSVFYWQEDPNKIQQGRKSGKWLKVEIIAVKGPMAVISTGASIVSGKRK